MLTVLGIEGRYHDEWILVADPEADEHLNVLRGQVVAHSQDRDEVGRRAVELRLKQSAFLYTCGISNDVTYVSSPLAIFSV